MDCWSRTPYLLLLLFLVSAAIVHVETACASNDPCETNCSGCVKYDKVADPKNCRGYYLCDSETTTFSMPLLCRDGQVYDAVTHKCVPGDTCEPCKSSTACGYDSSCPTDCKRAPVSFSCKYYYDCSVGLMQCQDSNPFFDGISCQSDESRCLHCRAYCKGTDVGKFKPDPRDCRKYYFCTKEGFPGEMGMCPDGQYFDSTSKNCSDKTCSTLDTCRNVVDDDGCIEPFTCLATGSFPKCPKLCSPHYYYCAAATGKFADARNCSSNNVFHPDRKTCVSQSHCPY